MNEFQGVVIAMRMGFKEWPLHEWASKNGHCMNELQGVAIANANGLQGVAAPKRALRSFDKVSEITWLSCKQKVRSRHRVQVYLSPAYVHIDVVCLKCFDRFLNFMSQKMIRLANRFDRFLTVSENS